MSDTIPSERAHELAEPLLRNELLSFRVENIQPGYGFEREAVTSAAPVAMIAKRIILPYSHETILALTRVAIGDTTCFEGELSGELLKHLRLRVPMKRGDRLKLTFLNTTGCNADARGAVIGRRMRSVVPDVEIPPPSTDEEVVAMFEAQSQMRQ